MGVWETVGRVTGMLAWFVGIADVVMSCCSDTSEGLCKEHRHQPPSDAEGLCKDHRHQPPSDDAGIPEAIEPSCNDWPMWVSQYEPADYGGGSVLSSAPADSPKGMDEAKNPFGEPDSSPQPPMVQGDVPYKHFDGSFTGLVGA